MLGLPFTERRVLVAGKGFNPALHGSYSPSGVVPVLHVGGGGGGGGELPLQIWDSLAICEWAAEQPPSAAVQGGARGWPADARARAVARSLAAEMHSGFAAVRAALSCNIRARWPAGAPPRVLEGELAAQVARLEAAWGGARREYGARGGGPFLFGAFCAADAMFAPVAFRFQTYGVALRDADAAAYVAALLQLDAMREWAAAALAEGDVIAHYDAAALAAGAELVPAAAAAAGAELAPTSASA